MQQSADRIHFPQAATASSIDNLAEHLTAAINTAAQAAIPRLHQCERLKPWWNQELTTLCKALHSSLRAYKRSRSETSRIEWKNMRNTYSHAIRDEKTKHWKTFLATAAGKEVFLAARYTRPGVQAKIPNITTESGEARTFDEKCRAFISTLFPPPACQAWSTSITCQTQNHLHTFNTRPLQPSGLQSSQRPTCSTSKDDEDQVWPWPDLSSIEVRNAIMTSSPAKAPGPDRLGFAVIQQAYAAAPSVFEKTYTLLFNHGYYPKCWREGIGVVLPKPKKDDYSKPKAYRIITLLNCLEKVLEKILAVRLSYLANTTTLLHDI